MKHSLLAALVIAGGLAGLAANPVNAQAVGAKLGYVNSQQILAQAPGAAEAQRSFEADMDQYRAEVDRLGQELDSLRTDFERQQATLSADSRQQREKAIQEKFNAYQQRVAELEQTAQRRQAELVSPIMQRISEAIEAIRAEGNYAMILDASAGTLAAADTTLDLTGEVLRRLRAASGAGQ